MAALRIVSLLPSATEIVCALGAGENLVGISHECDFPEAIRDRPVVTHSRIDAHGSSRAIDTAVRAAVVHDALSVYAVDEAMLGALAPAVLVTQDLCEVCAVSLDDVRTAVARLAHREKIRIVSLRPTRLEDVLTDVERVATAIGRETQGTAVRAALSQRISAIADRAARAARAASQPRVVTLEWMDPLMLGGTWMPELIALAGGIAVGASAGQPAPTVEPRTLAELRPDVVVVKPCGFSLERALAERDVIERTVTRVIGAAARVYVTDGNAFFNRPGPRLVESLEIMAACVHPALFGDFARKHRRVITRLPPPFDPAKQKAATTYNAAADHYDVGFWDRYGERTVTRLGLARGARVLDVACGTGASAVPAAMSVGPTGKVIAVDLAGNMLARASAKAAAKRLSNIEFRSADMTALGFADGAFDAVVCVFGIFFVADMGSLVAELWRMVTPGGKLAITTWGPRIFEPMYGRWNEAVRAERPDLRAAFNPWDRIVEPAGVRCLLGEAGISAATVVAESGTQMLARPEDWWTIVLGSGLRWTVEQLGPEAAERVKRDNLAWARENAVCRIETNVVYAVASKPAI